MQYSLKRAGSKGEGKFEKITWDHALNLIASKLDEQKEEHRFIAGGPSGFDIFSAEKQTIYHFDIDGKENGKEEIHENDLPRYNFIKKRGFSRLLSRMFRLFH